MKRYLFVIGLCLVLLGTGWLIHTVRAPLPSDGVHSYFAVRAKRGNATLALFTVFLGLGLILADTLTTPNPRLERIEREKEVLREQILGLLALAQQSQQELNVYIEQVYGRTGLIGLDNKQLRDLKPRLGRRINVPGE